MQTFFLPGVLEEVMEENKNHFLKEFQIEIPLPIVITSGNNWGNMSEITYEQLQVSSTVFVQNMKIHKNIFQAEFNYM